MTEIYNVRRMIVHLNIVLVTFRSTSKLQAFKFTSITFALTCIFYTKFRYYLIENLKIVLSLIYLYNEITILILTKCRVLICL